MYKKLLLSLALLCQGSLMASEVDNIKTDSTKSYTTPSVTVTSTKAEAGVTPIPYSEIGTKDIEQRYITDDMPKLLSTMPSVMYSSQNGNGIGYSSLTMRGFDQRRIAVLVNGIPQNDPEDHQVYWIDLPDLAGSAGNIQVQRGAGLSNYGSPSIGGLINITTGNYANTQGVKIFSGIGLQELGANGNTIYKGNTSKLSFEISSGLINDWAFYAKLSRIKSDGYRENSYTDMQSYFLSASHFSENFSTQINIFGGPVGDGLAYNGIPKEYVKDKTLRRANYEYYGWAYDSTGKNVTYTTNRMKEEIEEFSQPHFEILNNWQIDEDLTLQSSLFYYQGVGFFDGNSAWADGIFDDIIKDEYPISDENRVKGAFTRSTVDNKHGGWIPRLIYKTGDHEITVGGELRIHRSDHYGKILFAQQLPEGYDMDFNMYSYKGGRDVYSLFIKDKYKLNDNWFLFGDIQLVHHKFMIYDEKIGNKFRNYVNSDGNTVGNGDDIFNVPFTFVNPRAGATYIHNENLNMFAFVAYTSREPRMRNLYNASDTYWSGELPKFKTVSFTDSTAGIDFSSPIAKPEKMLDFEFGLNYTLSNFKLSSNIYYMLYSDELVKTGKLDIWGNPVDENASKSTHYGLEIEAAYKLDIQEGLAATIWGNTCISKNYFNEYDIKLDEETSISLKDNSIMGFPDIMFNFGLNVNYNDLFLGLTGKYVGEFYTDNYGEMLQNNSALIKNMVDGGSYYYDNVNDAYFVFDLDLSYTFRDVLSMKSIKLQAQVSNLLNKLYSYSGEGMEFFAAQERYIFLGFELGL